MKKINILFLSSLIMGLCVIQTGCYGPFRLTRNLHEWNNNVGDQFINSLVFYAFLIIPVYQVSIFIDGVVFNTIEFWTGENPIYMRANQEEVRIIKKDGKKYRITATKNKFHIQQTEGPNKGDIAELIFDPQTQSWYLKESNRALIKLVEMDKNTEKINVYLPNGKNISMDLNYSQIFTNKTISNSHN